MALRLARHTYSKARGQPSHRGANACENSVHGGITYYTCGVAERSSASASTTPAVRAAAGWCTGGGTYSSVLPVYPNGLWHVHAVSQGAAELSAIGSALLHLMELPTNEDVEIVTPRGAVGFPLLFSDSPSHERISVERIKCILQCVQQRRQIRFKIVSSAP
eukprot:6426672-Amphidinium_carterae.1